MTILLSSLAEDGERYLQSSVPMKFLLSGPIPLVAVFAFGCGPGVRAPVVSPAVPPDPSGSTPSARTAATSQAPASAPLASTAPASTRASLALPPSAPPKPLAFLPGPVTSRSGWREDFGTSWGTSGHLLAGDAWVSAEGITALDCEDRSGWRELSQLGRVHPRFAVCGTPDTKGAHRKLLCKPGLALCLVVNAQGIALLEGTVEKPLLAARPEDVRPLSPRDEDGEVVFHVGQRNPDGSEAIDAMRYGSQAERAYKFSFAVGKLEEANSYFATYPIRTQLALLGVTQVYNERETCIEREGHRRCWDSLNDVVPYGDGVMIVLRGVKGSTLVGLDQEFNERFRVGGLGVPYASVHPVPRADGSVLVVTSPEALVLDGHTGAVLAHYPMNYQHDSDRHATGEVHSMNGMRLVSCVRDALVVRDASTGKTMKKFAAMCALDPKNKEDSSSVPEPSPDGRFAALRCKGDVPCVVRLHDGATLPLRAGLAATNVRAFFSGAP